MDLDDVRGKLFKAFDAKDSFSLEDFEKEYSKVDTQYNQDMFKFPIKFVNKSNNEDPAFATEGAAGFDFRSNQMISIYPGEFEVVATGLYFELPPNLELQVRPRSGLSFNYGITVLNSPGTIDCVVKGTKISIPGGDILVEDIFESKNKVIIKSFNDETNSIENDVVSDVWIVNGLELLEIELEDGAVIKIPKSKEVMTNNGWKMAINLTENDKILKLTSLK
jgi:dUTPase